MPKKQFLILIILLSAFALRTLDLTAIPPGLTHDEANHGREAMGILDGIFLFYFPLNYGSEPLYSYVVAGSMWLFGISNFSLRMVNVYFGLLVLVITYLWATRAFNQRTAILTMALMAVSFWPLASSREALRAGMLPFFIVVAIYCFWEIIQVDKVSEGGLPRRSRWFILGFGISVAITLHIYLAARVAWLLFPLFLAYLALLHKDAFRHAWLPTLIGLSLAGLMTVPMFTYVNNHPEVLTRLDMLDRPLEEIRAGNFVPLIQNARSALLALIWPGFGDKFLAYNIPGRPTLNAVTALFFVAGILTVLRQYRQPSYAFVILWLVIGIAPSLITGATANTTRNLAAITAVYLIAAIGFMSIASSINPRSIRFARPLLIAIVTAWLLFVGWRTTRDYFTNWGQSPAVRGAYQHTLVQALDYLEQQPATSPIIISSVYPGPVHDPSIRLVMLPKPKFEMRWVDARQAFVLPDERDARALIPASTPLHPVFSPLLQPTDWFPLRANDLDPDFTVYEIDRDALDQWDLENHINFANAILLRHYRWLSSPVYPGEVVEMLTIWEVVDPSQVGPVVPTINTTDVVIFTQVINSTGEVLSQRDSLEAPSWDWQIGDLVLQIHPVTIPEEAETGSYETIVGIYDRHSGKRLPRLNDAGEILDDRVFVTPLRIQER